MSRAVLRIAALGLLGPGLFLAAHAATGLDLALASGQGDDRKGLEWRVEAAKGQRLPPDVEPKVGEIVRPLHSAPSILTEDQTLIVELDAAKVGDPQQVTASLRPSFGHARTPVPLGEPVETEAYVPSGFWPGREVVRLHFELPAGRLDGLHDLKLRWSRGPITETDTQRRAVNVVREHTDSPRVVIIADPSVGDPRPYQDGVEAGAGGDLEKLREKFDKSLGISDGRIVSTHPVSWATLKQTLDEINLIEPDFVLVTGDVTFGIHPRAAPYEYEDAYQLFDEVEVPTFFAPGNHDLYEFDGYAASEPDVVDGQAMWQAYFGPLHYSVDVGPALHLVALNTFDWERRVPFPPPDLDTLSGGQIRAEQLEWLRRDLQAYRRGSPDGHIVTFAHHDPSWMRARHPWPGENRLTVRDLLAEHGVGAHFAGHTHEDRVARYHKGNIVQSHGRPHVGQPVAELSYMRRDDSIDDDPRWTQDRLGRILRQPHWGPLFVTTTTAASGLEGPDWGLGGYWGWRLADLTPEAQGGYDPQRFGYPASREFLDEAAMRPENWNADHSVYGVFSYPSDRLHARTLEGNDAGSSRSTVELESGLATAVEVTVRLALADDGGTPRAQGGEIVRIRRNGDAMDVWVRADVPAEASHTVTASTAEDD